MKDLKIEYQKLTEDNVPDLWDRIEAGIDKIEEQQAEENNSSKIIEIKKSAKKKNNILKYMPIAATAAMLLFSLGIYMMMKNGGMNMASAPTADYAASDSAASDSAVVYEDVSESAGSYEEVSDSKMEYEEACDTEMEYEEACDTEMEYEKTCGAEMEYEKTCDSAPGSGETVSEIATNKAAKVRSAESNFETENLFAEDTIREVSGKVIIEDNENFALVTTEDGEEIEVFIPAKLLDNINQIADSDVDIVLERADKSLISTFPEEYKEVCWKIKEIE